VWRVAGFGDPEWDTPPMRAAPRPKPHRGAVGVRGALIALALLAGCGGDKAEPLPAAPDTIQLTTPDFTDGGPIPRALACDGAGTAPTITWRGVQGAAELVLFVDDPDAGFTHWTAYGISAAGGSGQAPQGRFPAGTRYGKNSAGKTGWTPPCPPKGDDPHHYVFALYALKTASALPAGAKPDEVRAKLAGAVARGTFTGTYARG
jgi:Raf kinase inhibitor-like YbhB/YbcL family protein